jgi:hypothetical protein
MPEKQLHQIHLIVKIGGLVAWALALPNLLHHYHRTGALGSQAINGGTTMALFGLLCFWVAAWIKSSEAQISLAEAQIKSKD